MAIVGLRSDMEKEKEREYQAICSLNYSKHLSKHLGAIITNTLINSSKAVSLRIHDAAASILSIPSSIATERLMNETIVYGVTDGFNYDRVVALAQLIVISSPVPNVTFTCFNPRCGRFIYKDNYYEKVTRLIQDAKSHNLLNNINFSARLTGIINSEWGYTRALAEVIISTVDAKTLGETLYRLTELMYDDTDMKKVATMIPDGVQRMNEYKYFKEGCINLTKILLGKGREQFKDEIEQYHKYWDDIKYKAIARIIEGYIPVKSKYRIGAIKTTNEGDLYTLYGFDVLHLNRNELIKLIESDKVKVENAKVVKVHNKNNRVSYRVIIENKQSLYS